MNRLYAYGQKMTRALDGTTLKVWIEFANIMLIKELPAAANFVITVDDIAITPDSLEWRDEFSLLLNCNTISGNPATVYAEFIQPDDGLRTKWNKHWEPFGKTWATDLV